MAAIVPADVAAWLGLPVPTGDRLTAWQLICDAVESHYAANWPPDPLEPPDGTGRAPSTRLGLIMMAARLTKRPASPEGIAGAGELGPVYVARFDPDIDRMLPYPQTGAA